MSNKLMASFNGVPAGYESDSDDTDAQYANKLKIRVVPCITTGAGIGGVNFDSHLTSEVAYWFEMFRDQWNAYKRTPTAEKGLYKVYMEHEDPLLLALKLFVNCPGCSNIKPKSLELFLFEVLRSCHNERPSISKRCDDNTRMVAFNFVKTSGLTSLCFDVFVLYNLMHIQSLLVPKLKELVTQGLYKDAAYWAICLKVTYLFDIYEIPLPLILQDKIPLAEEYLDQAVEQRQPLLEFLDSLLDRSRTIVDNCHETIVKKKYVDVKHNVLTARPLIKLITRLAKKYNFDDGKTPNLTFNKSCKYMHYFFHKFDKGDMSLDSWREVVADAATTKPLQLHLISYLHSNGCLDEAVHWVEHFKIPLNECPYSVQQRAEALAKTKQSQPLHNGVGAAATSITPPRSPTLANNRDEYLALDLPNDCISVVDSKASFMEMLSYLSGVRMIAFDAEWKPSVQGSNDVSLLQLATSDRVYLLDCLSQELQEYMWRKFGQQILNNLEILKVGFSLDNDLNMLDRSLPLRLNMHANCYLDMKKMWQRLLSAEIINFPKKCGRSLSDLTQICLGKKLDKSNQCSNWEKRPLRQDQIIYAALDAHCLLKIYNVLDRMLSDIGINIERVVEEIVTGKNGYLQRVKCLMPSQRLSLDGGSTRSITPELWKTSEVTGPNAASIPTNFHVRDVKLICDGMLICLTRELRKIGFDCIEINKGDVRESLKLAKMEDRFLLTTDNDRLKTFKSHLSATRCILLASRDNSEYQVHQIINTLNIAVFDSDLYTRCMNCNSTHFILAHQKHLMQMFNTQPVDGQPSNVGSDFQPVQGLSWIKLKYPNIINITEDMVKAKQTTSDCTIKYRRVKQRVLNSNEYFIICDRCGTCTWDGMHCIPTNIMRLVNITTQKK